MITVSVLYPKTNTSHFDHEYYLGTHIPLVKALWTATGLERVQLFRGNSTLDGSPMAYEMIGLLTFSSPEAMSGALVDSGSQVLGDIPNFTDVLPEIQVNLAVE